MPEPTNHEVNVRLAEFMKVEPCEHGGDIRDDEFYCDPQSYGDLDGGHLCFHCDGGVPAYTESLDSVRGVIHKIEKEHLYEEYVNHLYQGVFKLSESPILEIVELNLSDTFLLVNATANQRARACLKVIEEVGK